MSNSHSIIFFGQNAALLVHSEFKNDPYTYLHCFKKTFKGVWERPYEKNQGDVFNCTLEDIIMIQKVLNRTLSVWTTSSNSSEKDVTLSFEWEDDSKKDLWISLGNYIKAFSQSQTEIFNLLLSHIIEEKICHATALNKHTHTLQCKIKHVKLSKVLKKHIEKELIINEQALFKDFNNIEKNNSKSINEIDENFINNSINEETNKEITPIEGSVKGETEKALLINFRSGKEKWIPKSTIKCQYSPNRGINQKFLIENWILKKNKILLG